MFERGSRGYMALAGLLIVQLIAVIVYLWPWPGFGRNDLVIEPAPFEAVGAAAQVEGMPTIVDPADIDIPDAPPVPDAGLMPMDIAAGLSVEASIDGGVAVSDEWAPGAALVAVDMQIDWPQDGVPETVTEVSRFGYIWQYWVDVAGEVPATLIIQMERNEGRVVETRVDPLPIRGEVGIDAASIEVWDTAAVLAIEMLGGTAFRAACPTVRYTTIVRLEIDPETGEPVWNVEYPEADANSEPLIGRVDAITGEATIVQPGASDC